MIVAAVSEYNKENFAGWDLNAKPSLALRIYRIKPLTSRMRKRFIYEFFASDLEKFGNAF